MAVFRVANQAAILRVGNVIRRHSARTGKPNDGSGCRAKLPSCVARAHLFGTDRGFAVARPPPAPRYVNSFPRERLGFPALPGRLASGRPEIVNNVGDRNSDISVDEIS